MSEEDFLSRWSRRKRAAEQAAKVPPDHAPAARAPVAAGEPQVRPAEPGGPDASSRADADRNGETGAPSQRAATSLPRDPSISASDSPTSTASASIEDLPPIDSITAATDITPFLRKGVPLELSRAALRRAWVTDPAIRDFVGLAENAWDFNDPTAMPGFGPLDQSPEQVRQLVAALFGDAGRKSEAAAEERAADGAAETASAPATPQPTAAAPSEPQANAVASVVNDSPAVAESAHAATQNTSSSGKPVRRSHGGAVPR